MPSTIPDIGVRLTASGVQDVINAFRKVQFEAKNAQTNGVGVLSEGLASLSGLLPAISIATAVAAVGTALYSAGKGAVSLALEARETAEAIGKLSEKTGAGVGMLSALSLAAHDSEVTQEELSNGLVKLARNQEDATNGSAKALKAFTDLGITLNDLKTLDPGQLFVKVSQNAAAMAGGAQKAQIAIALFGKTGANLIPMINSVGAAGGFDEAVAKAKKLGLYLNDDLVRDARAAQDAVHSLEDLASGFGTQLVAGFAGPLATSIEGVAKALTDLTTGGDGFQAWGNAVGNVTLDVASKFNDLWHVMTVGFRNADIARREYLLAQSTLRSTFLGPGLFGGAEKMDAADQKNRDGIEADVDAMRDQEQKYKDAKEDLADAKDDLKHPTKSSTKVDMRGGGASGDGTDEAMREKAAAEAAKLAVAKSAYLQGQADNELAILKTKNQLAEADDKRSYEAGLISLDAYYDQREARIKTEGDAELAALARKQAAVAAMPDATPEQRYKKDTEAAKVQTAITLTQIKEAADLKAAEDARAADKHTNALKELEDTAKIQKASGDTFGAERTQLQVELQQYDELLQKRRDLTDEQRKALLTTATTKGEAKIGFSANEQQLNAMQQGMDQDIGAVQDQANSGVISQVAAEVKILDIERERLAIMQVLADVILKQGQDIGEASYIQRAEAYVAALKHQKDALVNVKTAQTDLINQLSSQGPAALEEFFTAGISGSKSFGEALGDLSKTFENIVAKMISQLLVFYALKEVLGFIGVDQSTITGIIGSGPFAKGFAGGGYTGDGGAGQVAGVVHKGEYVFDAATTKANRALFDVIKAGGMMQPSIIPISSTQKISTDYIKQLDEADAAAPAAGAVNIQIIDGSGQKATTTRSTQSDGSQLIQVVLGEVAKSVKTNGVVGQALTSTFGVQRQGVKRG